MRRIRAWARGGPWVVLRHRDYRLLWMGQLVNVTGTAMRTVAVAWQVYLISHDPLQLGILGLSQAVALISFSLAAGVIVDATDRRRLLLVVQTLLAGGSLVLAVTTWLGVASLPLIYVVTFCSAAVSAFDLPTRQALIPALVPREELPDALSLNALLFNLASIVGPVLGGLVIASVGVVGTYLADVASYLAVVVALLLMRPIVAPVGGRPRASIGTLVAGFSYLRARPVLLGLMALDFCAMFFGSPQGLLPIYARDILHVGPQGLGILLSSGAIGAVLAVGISGRLRHVRRQGLGVLFGVGAWGICVVGFGLTNGPLLRSAPWRAFSWQGPFWLAVVFLAGAGASDLVSMVLRNTIVQTTTPDEMRGRVGSINAMFIIGGPTLGQFESGVVASLLTPQLSALTGGLACLAATMIIAVVVPGVRRYRPASVVRGVSPSAVTPPDVLTGQGAGVSVAE